MKPILFNADMVRALLRQPQVGAAKYEREINMTISEIVDRAHQNAVKHGFWENPPEFGTAIALIHSELSEALEEMRVSPCPDSPMPLIYYTGDDRVAAAPMMDCQKPEGVAIELADALIRIADLCGQMEIDLESAIALKMECNEGRPFKHGKLF